MPDENDTALQNQIFETTNIQIEEVAPTIKMFVGSVMPNEAVGAIGEAGFFATYQSGPNAGTSFLFCIMNFGMITKSARMPFKIKMPVVM
jgi:hypothetical protein